MAAGTGRPATELAALTERQREVLELIARGYSNAEIGARLGISLDGAKWHVSEVLARLDFATREDAAEWWRQHNRLPVRLRRRARALFVLPALKWAGSSPIAIAISVTAVGGVLFGLVAVGFVAGRELRSSGQVVAQLDADEPPGPDVTPEPGATPDTSQHWWYVPYQNEDSARPRYERVVAGIRLGPDVVPPPACEDRPLETVSPAVLAGTTVEIRPGYLPSAALLDYALGWTCGGVPAASLAYYWIPVDEDDMQRVTSGELSFFDAQHGGRFEVMRFRVHEARFSSDFASDRFEATTIGGRSAAIGPPLFAEGWGRFEVYIWDSGAGVLTLVRGRHVSLDEILLVAEGLFE